MQAYFVSAFECILIGRHLGFLLERGLGKGKKCPRAVGVRHPLPPLAFPRFQASLCPGALIQHGGESTRSRTINTTRAHGKRLHRRLFKIMYLKPFKNFTYLVVFQNRAGSPLWRKQTKRWRPLKAAFVTWTFRLPPVFFWTFSFHLQILHVFLKFKTSVLWNNCFAKLFKETSFSKATMVMRFPTKKKRWLPKSTVRFPAKKKMHSPPPVGLCCNSSLPPPESVRAYADVTTKISRMDRLPNFLSYASARAPLQDFFIYTVYTCAYRTVRVCYYFMGVRCLVWQFKLSICIYIWLGLMFIVFF